jgi:hypothetical protein
MKKSGCFIAIGIFAILIIGFLKHLNSEMEEVAEAFHSMHSLEDSSFVLISSSPSPDETYKYYEYQFDNGGFGYSRVFWTVIKNGSTEVELQNGLIPDGYKVIGWTNESELILEKWEPYYHVGEKIELEDGMKINKVKIILKN